MANPVRVRFTSSLSSAQLRGVTGEPTDGITLQGTYQAAFDAFKFDVNVSGLYEKFEDPLGGSSYTQDTGWGTKFVNGDDLEDINLKLNSIRLTANYTDLDTAIKDGGASPAAGRVVGAPGTTEVVDMNSLDINLASQAELDLPANFTLNLTKTGEWTNNYGGISTYNKSHTIIRGGRIICSPVNDDNYSEHDAAIHLRGSNFQIVSDLWIDKPAGDGVAINRFQQATPPDDEIPPEFNIIQNCRLNVPVKSVLNYIGRCGASVTDGKKIIFQNLWIRGGSVAGIDIEPNPGGIDDVEEVIIENVFIDGLCLGKGTASAGDANSVTCDSLSVTLNQLSGYYVTVVDASTQETQTKEIVGNTATVGGSTQISVSSWNFTPASSDTVYISETEEVGTAYGITIGGGQVIKKITLNNVFVQRCAEDGIRLQGGNTTEIILNNVFSINNIGHGIETAAALRVLMSNVYAGNNGTTGSGISAVGSIGINIEGDYVSIENSMCCYNGAGGIWIGGSRDYFIITGSYCFNNSQLTANTYDGIRVFGANRGIISNNFCFDTTGTMQRYGIRIDADATNVLLGQNNCHGNVSEQVSVGSADSLINGMVDLCDGRVAINGLPVHSSFQFQVVNAAKTAAAAFHENKVYPSSLTTLNFMDVNGGTIRLTGNDSVLFRVYNVADDTPISVCAIGRDGSNNPTIGFLGANVSARLSHVADAETDHSLAGEATVDIAALKIYMDSLGTKINSILSALETFGFHATS
jgi:hypothetical protein